MFACNSEGEQNSEPVPEAKPEIDYSKYPENLQKVFEKHGGLEAWRKMNSLEFEMVKEAGNETHIVHLKDRRGKAVGDNFQIGYNGNELWHVTDTTYKGNPKFYHNLMFYFYAMPFVLADDGINYSETEPIVFKEKTYPGIKISYGDSVGVSPQDEYLLHYDPDSYQMTWLGYTATFFTQMKGKTFNWIRYDNWGDKNGLLLPNSITWYKVEEGQRTEPRSTRVFENVRISETPPADSVFAKKEGAESSSY